MHTLQPMTRPRQTHKNKNTIYHTTLQGSHTDKRRTRLSKTTKEGSKTMTKTITRPEHPYLLCLRRSLLSCQPASAAEHLQCQTQPHDTVKQERKTTLPQEQHGATNIPKGDGPTGDGIRRRYSCSCEDAGSRGSQGERGTGPRFIGRTCVTTTIGNCLRSNKMIKKKKKKKNGISWVIPR
jgi:hypothetical protein